MNSVTGFLFAALVATYIAIVSSTPKDAPKLLYTNSWAVEIEGGHSAAESLAVKYGFINKGQVIYQLIIRTHCMIYTAAQTFSTNQFLFFYRLEIWRIFTSLFSQKEYTNVSARVLLHPINK